MWRILKAEFEYGRLNFIAFLCLVSVVLAVGVYRPSFAPLLIGWAILFIGVNNWNAFRIKEKRDFRLVQLPVSARDVALARLLVIVISCGAFAALYVLSHAIAGTAGAINVRMLLMVVAIVISIFSLALMFRDRFLGTRALGQGKAVIVVLLSAAVVANVYGLILARRARATGEVMPDLVRVFEFVRTHNPSASNPRIVVFLAVTFALAYLTIVTFKRRRTHLE